MARILVVDDQESIRRMLESDGHEVRMASDGQLGLDAYRLDPVDLILTDLVMPNKTGVDMIIELKKEFPNVKILAVSGGGGITGEIDYLPFAQLVGAVDVLHKPFGLKELLAAVKHALS